MIDRKILTNAKHLESVFYIILFAAFALGTVFVFRMRFNSFYQFSMLLVLSIFYFVWGMFYHYLRRDLTIKVFWEYLAIWAIVAVAAVLVFLK